MKTGHFIGLQAAVFFLVAAAFTNIYITQPVLPVLAGEFGINETSASLTISVVILGIALSNIPFGMLADKYRIKPLIVAGGTAVSIFGLFCALTHSLGLLIAARFFQGLFIPSLTTCLAAYLAKNLPLERLNVVMGSYVAATVAGGLGGRLLGGWIHPPLHWRYAFVSASLILLAASLTALLVLPKEQEAEDSGREGASLIALIRRPELLRTYLVGFGAMFVFSSTFNFLPFYLSGPPFNATTKAITYMYLSYVIGIFMGPMAGRISNRIGNGATMMAGSVVFAAAVLCTLIPSIPAVILGLAGVCAGFFAVHASAAGSLNRKLTAGRGRANSLYVLFYYLGGYTGITASGHAYLSGGWHGVVFLGLAVLTLPFFIGMLERRV